MTHSTAPARQGNACRQSVSPRQRLIGLCLALLCSHTAFALELSASNREKAHPLGSHYSYLEDPDGSLTLQQILEPQTAQRFKPLESGDEPNFGYSRSSFWLQVPLQVHGHRSSNWMLELPFPTLDQIDLFLVEKRNGKLLQHYRAGDRQPFAERPYPHRNFVFPLNLPARQPLDLYLRIRSQGSLTVGALLWPSEAFHLHSRKGYTDLSLYFGILIALFFYNLLLYQSLRDRVYLYYIALVGFMAVGQAAWKGIGYEYLWPTLSGWANVAAVAGFNGAGLFGAIFTRQFLELKHHSPRLDRLVLGCAGVFGLMLLSIPLLPYQFNAIVTSITGVVFSFCAAISGVVCLRRGNISARYFLLAWSILLIGVAALGARNLGWLPTNNFTRNAMLIGSAIEMLLLSFALAERIYMMRRAKEAAEHEALDARRSMLKVLEQTELELENKVNERTRELEQVNRRLKTREKQLESLAHHDPLTGLPNRLSFEMRISETLSNADSITEHPALLLLDLDGFKPINDRHGHDIGDDLLRIVGRRLQRCVRSNDVVARLGGDEFIILLEHVHNVGELHTIAEGIIQALSQPITLETLELQVSASIGIAVFPYDGEEQRSLLRRADQAMYRAKLAGKKRYEMAEGVTELN